MPRISILTSRPNSSRLPCFSGRSSTGSNGGTNSSWRRSKKPRGVEGRRRRQKTASTPSTHGGSTTLSRSPAMTQTELGQLNQTLHRYYGDRFVGLTLEMAALWYEQLRGFPADLAAHAVKRWA